MGEFLSYSITSGLLLLAMYLAYRIFLAGENQHSFNRSVLIGIYAVAFSLAPFVSKIADWNDVLQPQPTAIMAIEMAGESVSATALSEPLWATISLWIFVSGMIAVLIKTVITWGRLIRVINSGLRINCDGYTLVITDNEKFAPFSWMHYVVISRSDYASNYEAITAHELKHVASHHWVDLLIAQIVCIINWFNPAAWLMRDELMLIHEYQADMAVIDSGHNAQEYQMLLIKKAVGARFPSLANSLNHSKLKKRITMMYQEKSGAGRKFKALALVPMLALAIGVADVPSIRAAVSTIGRSGVSIDKSSESSAQNKVKVQQFKAPAINSDGKNAQSTTVGDKPGQDVSATVKIALNGKEIGNSSDLPDGMEIYLDGKKITKSEMEKLSPETIRSITVDKKNKTMMITSKEASEQNVIVVNDDSSSIPDDIEIYLDGKKITTSEMEKLSPESIRSITVDKKNKTMMITSK